MRTASRFLLGMAAAAGLASSIARAQGTITDAPSTFERGTSPWDSSPDGDFTGVSASPTWDQLFETGWAFRVAGDTREFFFPFPNTQTYVGDSSENNWADVALRGLFSAQEVSVVKNAAGPSGFVRMTMKVTNISGASLDIQLFHMVDFDVQPTASNDRATLLYRNNHIRITDPEGIWAEYRGVGAKAFLVRPYLEEDLGAVLDNAVVNDFDNTGLPFGPKDFTAGFQWSYVIPAGATASVTAVLAVNLSLVRGDFNDDSQADLLLRNNLYTRHVVWQMDGLTRAAELSVTPDVTDTNKHAACTEDFSGDGKTDIVFHDVSTGDVEFWVMGGPTGTDRQSVLPLTGTSPLSTDWFLAACGDVNRDGQADILWRNTVTQKLLVWLMKGNAWTADLVPTPDQAVHANWAVVALLDYNADGWTDFHWYNSTSGNNVHWFMDASFVRMWGQFTTPTNAGNNNWKVVAAGDYLRGGRDTAPAPTEYGAGDIIFRNDNSGRLVGWIMNGQATNPNGIVREFGSFTCPTAVGASCNAADPVPAPGALDWFVAGPR